MRRGRTCSTCSSTVSIAGGHAVITSARHIVLAWQLRIDWSFDPDFVTEVEVTFAEEGPNVTVVTLEHRDLDKYGVGADTLREGIDSPEGWGAIMANFAAEAAKP